MARTKNLQLKKGSKLRKKSKVKAKKPAYVLAMEAAYGEPNQTGFGSAVFFDEIVSSDDIEEAALEKYKYFLGDLWERFGEEAWLSQWKEVYSRKTGSEHDIVAELESISDRNAQNSIPMILNVVKDADSAKHALSNAYNDEEVTDLRVYNLGDDGAMSGLLVLGRRSNNDTTFLVFLMD